MGKKVYEILEKLKNYNKKFDVILAHLDSFYVIARCNPGILSLATVLHAEGFSVKVLTPIDFYCLSISEIEQFFKSSRPEIVGFYTNSDNIPIVREMSRKVRKWNPEAKIITGGPLATAVGNKMLEWPYFDAVICGEAENSLASYAKSVIRKTGRIDEIPSLVYREGQYIKTNPSAPPINDLDDIPPADLSFLGSRPQVLSISTGRGCPFGCAFCFQAVHGRGYRYRSGEKVVEDITDNLEKYNINVFSITDDTFVANPQRVKQITNLLNKYREKSGRDFRFYCEGRVDIFHRNPELLSELKTAGLIRLQVGIESGVQSIIDAYSKGIRLCEIEELVERLAELGGISLVGHFIIGGAFETEDTLRKSIEFAKKLIAIAPGIFESGIGFLCPYPGTAISNHPEKFDIRIIDNSFRDNLSTLEASCETLNIPIERLRVLKQVFMEEIDGFMRKNVPLIPFIRMKDHFDWAKKYGLTSFWYPYLIEKPAIEKYFFFLGSPRFFRIIDKINPDYEEIYPMRTIAILKYDKDGRSLKLEGSVKAMKLTDEVKIFIYRRSCGKNNLIDIAKETKVLFFPDEELEVIIRKRLIPFYRILEDSYYMNFYE